ncbi:MAG: hypothetical protein JWO36_5575 [Myxococcales bacterium]|nr:hypothetical protein [Myxococcales bacterium]
MQLALATPLFRSIALGSILFGLTLGAIITTNHHRTEHRLVLHTSSRTGAIYLTAWRHGGVRATFEQGAQLQPIVLKTRAQLPDGCRWMGIETLTPLDNNRYFYSYDEEILGCDPGESPGYYKTPRSGIVTVE